MTDSFTHSVPGIRDGNQMVVGGREVSREVVAKSLEDNEIVMLVPGGQHEIFTSRSFSPKVVISRKHKGFIRNGNEIWSVSYTHLTLPTICSV